MTPTKGLTWQQCKSLYPNQPVRLPSWPAGACVIPSLYTPTLEEQNAITWEDNVIPIDQAAPPTA